MAGLTLLRDAGKLSRLPLGITLVSPAVDMSNASVFGSREPVSSHFEQEQQQQQQQDGHQQCHQHTSVSDGQHSGSCSSSSTGTCSSGAGADGGGGERVTPRLSADKRSYQEANGGPLPDSSLAGQLGAERQQQQQEEAVQPSPAPSVAQLLLGGSFRRRRSTQQQQHPQHTQQQSHPKNSTSHTPLEPQGSFNVAEQQLEQQHVPLQHQPSVDCKMHAAHTAGGRLRPRRLASGLFAEAMTALRVHVSSRSAAQGAASGWFDYIPSDSFADELHCYLTVGGGCMLVVWDA
jgi:hypothetical protein